MDAGEAFYSLHACYFLHIRWAFSLNTKQMRQNMRYQMISVISTHTSAVKEVVVQTKKRIGFS